jgi:hypothetical protein
MDHPQGSSFLATLGWMIQSLRDCHLEFANGIGGMGSLLLEGELAVMGHNLEPVSRFELTEQQFVRERVQ